MGKGGGKGGGRVIMTHSRVIFSMHHDERPEMDTYKAAYAANKIMNERLGINTRSRKVCPLTGESVLVDRSENEKKLQERLVLHAPIEPNASLLPDDPYDTYTIPQDVERQHYTFARPKKYVILDTGTTRLHARATPARHARHPHDTRTHPSERTHTCPHAIV